MTTVLILDDQALQRRGLHLFIEAQPHLTVVGEAAGGAEAVRQTIRLRPDVVLMDVHASDPDILEITRRIVESGGHSRVLVLNGVDLDAYAYDVLSAGAGGFLLKDARPDELIAGIHAVAAGATVISPSLTRRLIDTFLAKLAAHAPTGERRLATLTERERDVLRGVASGWSNAEIGEHLFIAETTVKSHISRIFSKTGARDRVQAVVLAYETGLVHTGAWSGFHDAAPVKLSPRRAGLGHGLDTGRYAVGA